MQKIDLQMPWRCSVARVVQQHTTIAPSPYAITGPIAINSADLPIHALADDLRRTWREHNSLVIVAPTGSGKTTQVPQLLLADGICGDKRIVVLQPRRVAARSVAARVAQEMGVTVGELVGYQVRFDERLGPDTRIAYITEGILLRWLQGDPTLNDIGAVLFDEFHERNLLSDVALALCKQIQVKRPDLKLIVMSATLEAEPVAQYLNCPILESQGRSFPVEIRYQTWDDDRPVWERAAAQVVQVLRDRATASDAGDLLVFMPGMYEIQRTIDEIRDNWRGEPLALMMLHGDLPPREQDRIFAPSGYRRVIVATNVAETSITIPGIRTVIDGGQARIARYDPARGINTLLIEPISQASADQRAGRAGRTAPGVCYRLWSEKGHAARPPKNIPEVQRTELSASLLLLHAMGVRDVAGFDFLDKPDAQRIEAAETLLDSLGAIDDGAITLIGRRMLRIPAHPRYARMLIEAEQYGCVREVALMAALVSGRDLLMRISPRDERDRIIKRNRESLLRRRENTSDYFLYANSYEFAVNSKFDSKQCYQYGVNAHAAREVAQTLEQLLAICDEAGLTPGAPPLSQAELAEVLARCHLVGFLDHLAVRAGSGSAEYDLAHGRRGTLADESVVGAHTLIVASDIREVGGRNGNAPFTLLSFASAVSTVWIQNMNPHGLTQDIDHVYDRLHKRVIAGRVLRYHDLILGGERVSELDPAAAARILAEELVTELSRHPQWSKLKPRLANKSREQVIDLLAQAFAGASTAADAMKRDLLSVIR